MFLKTSPSNRWIKTGGSSGPLKHGGIGCERLMKMALTIDSSKAVFKHVSELQAKVKYYQ